MVRADGTGCRLFVCGGGAPGERAIAQLKNVDRVRPFGRGADGNPREPDASGLCGNCGDGRASIGPDGTVSPCVFSTWMGVGDIRRVPLVDILTGPEMNLAQGTIRASRDPKNPPPNPIPCGPDSDICKPGGPPSWCNPRR
ncbi:hypothetical protein BJF83_23715 [Nocardiopsis sp. CNR-923]|uniref:SPASM domain-containing protein n=1 Tax=Nocardiopsis sp. CNR-923 TaxID=1904965 RepID=UPI00095FD2F4|nr:SPASM domain-containing protein [Nocardiopsis sp. CNR-923]OLT24885.1 hypothetical protein BJF83_23715 [Nocardiopsis sp. CNR-923]